MDLKELKKDLGQFGKVEKVELNEDRLHIMITKGFSSKASATFNFLKYVSEKTGFETIIAISTDENACNLILSNAIKSKCPITKKQCACKENQKCKVLISE